LEAPLKENKTGGYRELVGGSDDAGSLASPNADDAVVPAIIPAIVALLLNLERKKGAPLTEDEVLDIRDKGVCVTMRRSMVRARAESRGYEDIDPENVWNEWTVARTQFASEGKDPE
jgi:hypothetical protein